MRVLVAPDSFKACLRAVGVARAIAAGVRAVHPEADIDLCPLSDGGEGFLDAVIAGGRAEVHDAMVTGPHPEQRVTARWAMLERAGGGGRTAIVELAEASGYELVPAGPRDPAGYTTFGTGQLLVAAAQAGATEILIGLGGSATIDGGLGLCQAVGHTILRRDGEPVSMTEPLCARDLADIYLIKRGRGSALDRVPITIAADVTNPLYGPAGAARMFGPQKGATAEQVAFFDEQHRGLAERTHTEAEASTPGAGAAGGVGWALLAFFNATSTPGLPVVAGVVGLRERIARADVVISGEGAFDRTSLAGKVPASVAHMCREMNKPCYLLAGQMREDPGGYFTKFAQVTPAGMAFAEAVAHAPALLEAAAKRLLA